MRCRRRGWRVHGAALLSLLALLVLPVAARAVEELPAFSNHVVDEAGVVPDDVERQVNATLGDYQARSSNQVAVAVVRTTGARPIEEYSLALATAWAVGEQGKDNGVLVVIAYEDRRVRIEVGRGLERVLTNQTAAGIINDGLVQRLRQGNVGAAVIFATDTIRRVLGDAQVAATPGSPVTAGVPPVQPGQTDRGLQPAPLAPPFDPLEPGGTGGGFPSWVFVVFPVMAVIGMVSSIGSNRRSGFRSNGPMFWGTGLGHGWHHSSSNSSGSSRGSGGHSSGGGGGSFGGGGGGSFGGGGASGSW